MKSTLLIPFLVAAVSAATLTATPAKSTALPFGIGQCGGVGYTGPTDCYDPYYTFVCVIVRKDYWACVLPPEYTCEDPSTGPANGAQCYSGTNIDGHGPDCCANAPEWLCISFTDDESRCLKVANYTPPATTTIMTSTTLTTSTTVAVPTTTACAPNYGMCGGLTWQGPYCCQGAPEWTCVVENEYFSNCEQA